MARWEGDGAKVRENSMYKGVGKEGGGNGRVKEIEKKKRSYW